MQIYICIFRILYCHLFLTVIGFIGMIFAVLIFITLTVRWSICLTQYDMLWDRGYYMIHLLDYIIIVIVVVLLAVPEVCFFYYYYYYLLISLLLFFFFEDLFLFNVIRVFHWL
jgi:hypothetical protein